MTCATLHRKAGVRSRAPPLRVCHEASGNNCSSVSCRPELHPTTHTHSWTSRIHCSASLHLSSPPTGFFLLHLPSHHHVNKRLSGRPVMAAHPRIVSLSQLPWRGRPAQCLCWAVRHTLIQVRFLLLHSQVKLNKTILTSSQL